MPTDLVAVVIFVLVTLLTSAHFMADTADYVDSIIAYDAGRNYEFWEFGHLFWRPLGWLSLFALKPIAKLFDETNERITVNYILLGTNWIAGLVSVCALRGFVSRNIHSPWLSSAVVIVFIFSHAFLNFSQTGCSYIPGLALLLVGLYLLTRTNEQPERRSLLAFAAGVSFAGAVCLWFSYILVLPAAVAMPLVLNRFDRKGYQLTSIATAVAVVCILIAYISVATAMLNITNAGQFRGWMSAASHGNDVKGITRVFFGFARSFVHMGNDGVIFKRYLVGDKFNPVSLAELFRLSLWKFVLFYAFFGAICFNLMESPRSRRVLYLLVAGTFPVIAFAVFFDGGAVERYLPLYPFVFLALSASLASSKSPLPLKWLVVAFCFVVILVDSLAMTNIVLGRQQQTTAARIADLQGRMKPEDRIVTVSWQDQLVNFTRSFPLHPINRAGNLHIGALVTPGTDTVSAWREDFAVQALATWQKGGDVWISQRVMVSRPLPDWNWVEGDDRRLSWTDFYEFFQGLNIEDRSGHTDGFVLIAPTQANKAFLADLLHQKQALTTTGQAKK